MDFFVEIRAINLLRNFLVYIIYLQVSTSRPRCISIESNIYPANVIGTRGKWAKSWDRAYFYNKQPTELFLFDSIRSSIINFICRWRETQTGNLLQRRYIKRLVKSLCGTKEDVHKIDCVPPQIG